VKKRSRILFALVLGFLFLSGNAAYNVYAAFYNHIMERSEAWHLTVEEVDGTHPLQLRITTGTVASAPIIRRVTTKRQGRAITVRYHLALAGLAKPELMWGAAYVLTVPDSVSELRFGRRSEVIWQRKIADK
jgi:hypothetical protein